MRVNSCRTRDRGQGGCPIVGWAQFQYFVVGGRRCLVRGISAEVEGELAATRGRLTGVTEVR